MSVRMLQRALRDQQELPIAEHVAAHAESEEEDATVDQAAPRNMFDLLGDQDNVEEDEDENKDTDMATSNPTSVKPSITPKAKKKKKAKKKGKHPIVLESTSDEEHVDQLLKRLTVENGASNASDLSRINGLKQLPAIEAIPVLAVDPRHLKAKDELRRIFGSKVINAVERSGEGSGLAGSGRRRHRHPGREGPLRRSILVVPWDNWPRWDGGVSMEHVETKGGAMYFRYVYSSNYIETQKRYEECAASHDPNAIGILLARHPYHIDSLLSLAEVCKQMGEYQQSAMFLEKCLYALECAWHPSFNPSMGNCRLDFSVDENKRLFSALFRHMQNLGRRGCHRTALEVCKLLLALDTDDPLGALFCIDYYALRAEQYEWLEVFVSKYNKDHSIALLPNFSFSLAIARFYLEQRPESAQAAISQNEVPLRSSDLLQQALMLHPFVLKKIVTKAPIKEDAIWQNIMKNSLFSKATAGGPSLEHLVNLYIERSHLIWRIPDLQSWLKSAALSLVELTEKHGHRAEEFANWACVRQEAFNADHNEYRHLLVNEFSDSTTTLPVEELQQLAFPRAGPGNPEAMQDPGLEGRNPIMLFLESLLPWMNYGVNYDSLDERDADAEEL